MRQAALVRKPVVPVVVPPSPSKRATFLSVGIVALLAILFWACDGFLLVRLRAIANEAYTNGPSNPLLTVDDVDALNAYPPRRLSHCLWFPSAQVRTVVCLAIGRRQTWKDSESWVGVLPALLKAHRESRDREFQVTAMQAMLSMDFIPAEDVDEVYKFIDEQLAEKEPWWTLCAHLLSVTADSLPEQRPKVLQAFERSLALPSAQYESTRRLARLAPASREAAVAVRAYTRSYPPTRGNAGTPEVRAIVLRQPALIDELLSGSTNQQLAVLSLAADDLMNTKAVLKDEASAGPRSSWLTWDCLQRMRRSALELSRRTNDHELLENREVLFSFLRYWWDGPDVLFHLAKSATGKDRALAFRYAAGGADRRTKPGAEQFFASIMPDLVQWLGENDAETRRSILYVLSRSELTEWLQRQSGATKESLVKPCRTMLDQFPGDFDFDCIELIAVVENEFDASDADRIAAVLERSLLVLKEGYERTNLKPQGSIHEAHKRLFDRLARFETRPAVDRAMKLRRSLEAQGIVGVRKAPYSAAVPVRN